MARPRARTADAPEAPPTNSLIASAVRLPSVHANRAHPSEAWMREAWRYYDRIGELRFVANWVGNVMSRARLYAAHREVVEGGTVEWVRQETGPAAEALYAYFGGDDGVAKMLAETGVNLTVAGQCYHVMRVEDGVETWYVLAHDKVTQATSGRRRADGGYALRADFGDGKGFVLLDNTALVIRLWTPHPVEKDSADSPVRSNLPTLAEIAMASEHVVAQMTSRLAGAGLLMLPSEITLPTPKEADPAATQADIVLAMLTEAMMTPIADRSNASAVVPIVVMAPGETLEKARHLTLWSPLDEKTLAMREAAVRRLAVGLDTPQEVLLGVQDSNHWNAWLVDESAIKSHLEPRLAVVAHAVTMAYLRPALKGLVGDPREYRVMADTASIRMRPNRSREAMEAYDRDELSGAALLRETGFEETDAPKDDERRRRLLRRVAGGSTSPEQSQAALRALGIDLGVVVTGPAQPEIPPVLVPRRTLEGHPNRGMPDVEDSQRRAERAVAAALDPMAAAMEPGLVAACEALTYRALERAGNRLCNGANRAALTEVPVTERYLHVDSPTPDHLLDGAWTYAMQVLDGLHPEPEVITAALDFYVRYLLTNRKAHSREALVASLIGATVLR